MEAIQGHAHRRSHMIHVDSPDSPRRSFHRIICICSSHHGFCKTRWWNAQDKWNFVVKLYKSWKKTKSTTWWSHQPSSNHLQLDHFHVIIGFDVDFGWKGDRPLSCCKLGEKLLWKRVKGNILQWIRNFWSESSWTKTAQRCTMTWQAPEHLRALRIFVETTLQGSCGPAAFKIMRPQPRRRSKYQRISKNYNELYRIILAVLQRAPKAKQGLIVP